MHILVRLHALVRGKLEKSGMKPMRDKSDDDGLLWKWKYKETRQEIKISQGYPAIGIVVILLG